jgi:Cdc6-like AAA superfamily ATPase
MSDSAVGEARRALARLRRAVEKADRELEGVAGALRHAEGSEFPEEAFDDGAAHVRAVLDFIDEQSERLAEKVLHAGGLEPGRVRRSAG